MLRPATSQCKENVRVASKELTRPVREAVERANAELGDEGRVLVRPSGTEPIIRVLVEARDGESGEEGLCYDRSACRERARLIRTCKRTSFCGRDSGRALLLFAERVLCSSRDSMTDMTETLPAASSA